LEVFLQTLVLAVSNVSIYILLGTSVSLLFGVVGILNFAQGDFMTVAAYVGYFAVVTLGMGWLASITLILPALVVLGVLFYFLVLRPTRNHDSELVLVATFGVALLLQGLVQITWGGVPLGIPRISDAWTVGGVAIPYMVAAAVVMAAVGLIGLYLVLGRTPFGREIRATSQDRTGAALIGINANRVELGAVVLSVVLTVLAGLMIMQRELLTPFVGFDIVLKAFAVAIVAGLGRVNGLLPAAVILGFAEGLVGGYISAAVAEAAIFGAVMLTLLVRPQGIAGARLRT
jgi:branched-chain amino acid transport system permease protein